MADTFTLEVVTPMRLVARETVSEAQIPVRGGSIGVLVEVLGDRVIVLADRAERAEEVDVPRAQAALERAQKRLATPNDPHVDWKRAEEALERAQVRLQVAAKAGAASVPAGSK